MRFNRFTKLGIAVLVSLAAGVPALGVTTHRAGSQKSATSGHSRFSKLRRSSWKRHGQQQITGDRAREIQEALIRERYLDGQPTGIWDARTTAAMRKFQADQGWQSKVVPDSRALIKLGLGPSHENDLNPDLMGDRTFSPLPSTDATSTDISQR